MFQKINQEQIPINQDQILQNSYIFQNKRENIGPFKDNHGKRKTMKKHAQSPKKLS